jgi:hypothetical protein
VITTSCCTGVIPALEADCVRLNVPTAKQTEADGQLTGNTAAYWSDALGGAGTGTRDQVWPPLSLAMMTAWSGGSAGQLPWHVDSDVWPVTQHVEAVEHEIESKLVLPGLPSVARVPAGSSVHVCPPSAETRTPLVNRNPAASSADSSEVHRVSLVHDMMPTVALSDGTLPLAQVAPPFVL